MQDFVLRRRGPEDSEFLAQLFVQTHRDRFVPLGLPESQLSGLLQMQARGQAMTNAAQFPHATDHVILCERTPVGRVLVDRTERGLHLVDIALLPAYRSGGIGSAILSTLCLEATEAGLPLTLTVQEYNAAKRLYLRAGFVVTGTDGMNAAMLFNPSTPVG